MILDANAGYSAEEVLVLLRELRLAGIEPALLEQPVAREDWEGLGNLTREAGVPVTADESCRTPYDALRIVRNRLAQAVNIKLVKCGVVQSLEIAAVARTGGLVLMIGGMVETRLAMSFSAHFAAGLGGLLSRPRYADVPSGRPGGKRLHTDGTQLSARYGNRQIGRAHV